MKGYGKLGRNSAHRKSMLRNLVTELFRQGRITTTEERAKEARRIAEKLITKAKRGDLHARRQVLEYVFDEDVVRKLFDDIAPSYAERNGGYTRILKLGTETGRQRGSRLSRARIRPIRQQIAMIGKPRESGAFCVCEK